VINIVLGTCQENNYGYFVDMDKFLEMQQLIKSRVAPSGDLSQNELARAIGQITATAVTTGTAGIITRSASAPSGICHTIHPICSLYGNQN